jgi:excisionase family DNA binding protein
VARMRYPQQALELIREEDPGTSITLNYIRALAYSGKIPCVKVGRRHLINVDALVEFLANPEEHNSRLDQFGKIRKIADVGRCVHGSFCKEK